MKFNNEKPIKLGNKLNPNSLPLPDIKAMDATKIIKFKIVRNIFVCEIDNFL